MVKHEGSTTSDNTDNAWERAINDYLDSNAGESANEGNARVPEEDVDTASTATENEALYPGVEDYDEQDVVHDDIEAATDYSADAVEALREIHDENESRDFVREKNSIDLLHEAYEDYDGATMDSLEAAERDQKETFWKRAGQAVTKVYRKLIGLAVGRKVETSAESAEATKEVAGRIGKKTFEVTKKLVEAGAAAATQTVMTNMGLGGE
jgi:hypothetical protein